MFAEASGVDCAADTETDPYFDNCQIKIQQRCFKTAICFLDDVGVIALSATSGRQRFHRASSNRRSYFSPQLTVNI